MGTQLTCIEQLLSYATMVIKLTSIRQLVYDVRSGVIDASVYPISACSDLRGNCSELRGNVGKDDCLGMDGTCHIDARIRY